MRTAGCVSVAAYDVHARPDAQLTALPALFIIVDEFSELLSQHPDFADMFVAIGRLGRSLGMHLLLASQRLDEGRLRGLEAHLSYRICLKTLSASESRAVLGTPDAYQLPNTPGAGYLRTGNGELIRFHTAYVFGTAPARHGRLVAPRRPRRRRRADVQHPEPSGRSPVRSSRMDRPQRTVLRTVLDRLSRTRTARAPSLATAAGPGTARWIPCFATLHRPPSDGSDRHC